MSTAQAHDMLDRAMTDRLFADRFRANPDAILEEYDVADDEMEALASREESRIRDVLGDIMAEKVAVIVIVL